eukprot:SAG31_NODE_3618_length_4063_cov_2.665237_3_plen_200_part_00
MLEEENDELGKGMLAPGTLTQSQAAQLQGERDGLAQQVEQLETRLQQAEEQVEVLGSQATGLEKSQLMQLLAEKDRHSAEQKRQLGKLHAHSPRFFLAHSLGFESVCICGMIRPTLTTSDGLLFHSREFSLAAELENDLVRAQRAETRTAAAAEREAASNAALRETLSQTEDEVRKKQREIQVSSVGTLCCCRPSFVVS